MFNSEYPRPNLNYIQGLPCTAVATIFHNDARTSEHRCRRTMACSTVGLLPELVAQGLHLGALRCQLAAEQCRPLPQRVLELGTAGGVPGLNRCLCMLTGLFTAYHDC